MEKRLTMLMVSLFLCVGSMLAQTKVSGTVLSQEDGQPIIGAAVKVLRQYRPRTTCACS